MEKIINLKNSLLEIDCKLAKVMLREKIAIVDDKVAKLMYEENTETVKKFAEEVRVEGKFIQNGVWKSKRKLCPNTKDPPMAKKDLEENLITDPEALKVLYMDTYKHRLRHREMKSEYIDIQIMKECLWSRRLCSVRKNCTQPWTMEMLDKALSSLKSNQARDPLGMLGDLFKPHIVGLNLKKAILDLLNGVKSNLVIPEQMRLASVTSIYKNKGSRFDLKNDRGIFCSHNF